MSPPLITAVKIKIPIPRYILTGPISSITIVLFPNTVLPFEKKV
jgi:hypothetical protein